MHVGTTSRLLGLKMERSMWIIVCIIFVRNVSSKCNIQVPYTPQQNGVTEHKNRALKEMATCMMEEKDLNPKIWDGDINCDAYVHNIYPQRFVRKDSIWGLEWSQSQCFSFHGFWLLGIGFLLRRERPCKLKERSPLWLEMINMQRYKIYLIPHLIKHSFN